MSKKRYIDRQSSGILILNQAEETYVHEDGESHGTGAQLDAGGICNKKMDELDALYAAANPDMKSINLLQAEIALIAAENDLRWDPNYQPE